MNVNELVERAKQNDNDAIKELYDLTARKGYFIALKYMNNEESANDVLQNAYVKVFQKLDTLEDNSRFESFLYTTITREAINFGKTKEEVHKTKTFSSMDSEEDGLEFVESIEDDTVEFQPDSAVDYSELKQAMNQIINELPQDQKMAILMYYFEELSVSEIAETFSVTKNTIKSRLKYGRDRIKEKVEEMQKSGRPIFGIAPIPFLLWMLQEEVYATSAPAMSTEIFSATQLAGSKTVTALAKEGVKATGKTISKKIIAGVISTAIVIGGGAYVLSQNNNTHSKPKQNDNQQTETEQTESKQTESQKLYDDLDAKETYEKAVDYFNKNIYYYVSESTVENDTANYLERIEYYNDNGKYSVIDIVQGTNDGNKFIQGIIALKNDSFAIQTIDGKIRIAGESEHTHIDYEGRQRPFLVAITQNKGCKIKNIKKSKEKDDIIIEIKYILHTDKENKYYTIKDYINKDGYLYMEMINEYSNEDMKNVVTQRNILMKDFNKKSGHINEQEISKKYRSLDGQPVNVIDKYLN